ncbi:MAG: hypothetical protein ACLGG7_04370 [Bacteriovoracia bacterium]
MKLDERYRKLRKNGFKKNDALKILLQEENRLSGVKQLYDHLPLHHQESEFLRNILTTILLFATCGILVFAVDVLKEFEQSGEITALTIFFKIDVFVAIASLCISYVFPQRHVESLAISIFLLANDAVTLSAEQDIVKLSLVLVAAGGCFFFLQRNLKILEKHRLDQPFEDWLRTKDLR